jgi:hypothetical protein
MTTINSACGPETHWAQKGVGPGQWIKIYPNGTPFNGGLVPAMSYTAAVTLSGPGGTYFLDVWDGMADHQSGSVVLSSTPATLSVPFTEQMGTPELQIRTVQADVDVTISNVAVYAN